MPNIRLGNIFLRVRNSGGSIILPTDPPTPPPGTMDTVMLSASSLPYPDYAMASASVPLDATSWLGDSFDAGYITRWDTATPPAPEGDPSTRNNSGPWSSPIFILGTPGAANNQITWPTAGGNGKALMGIWNIFGNTPVSFPAGNWTFTWYGSTDAGVAVKFGIVMYKIGLFGTLTLIKDEFVLQGSNLPTTGIGSPPASPVVFTVAAPAVSLIPHTPYAADQLCFEVWVLGTGSGGSNVYFWVDGGSGVESTIVAPT